MLTNSTLAELDFEQAMAAFEEGAALIDLRPVNDYLDVHVPGSISLLYESGPGMNTRARDCIPLKTPLVLLDLNGIDMLQAAAALRGKGFEVLGSSSDAINQWVESGGKPGSTEVTEQKEAPDGFVLDVVDPGAVPPGGVTRIPIEGLWGRVEELSSERRVVIVAGAGVRAAMAIGMLERAGVPEIVFWKTARSFRA
jgi:rhodanese-related sulfurtransferase